MAGNARVRFSLSTGEFEVEGDEDFVIRYESLLSEILKKMTEMPPPPPAPSPATITPAAASVPSNSGGDSAQKFPEFGEALHRLPKGASGTDQILIAGYYASRRSSEKIFSTSDASKLLIEQGIKLTNPSQSLKNNMEAKRVFKSGSSFRISRDGLDRVGQLLGLDGAGL